MSETRTPHHRIIVALHDIVMLAEDDDGRIQRDPVMQEVQHIRNDADQLQRELSAAQAKLLEARPSGEAVRLANEFIADPDARAQVKVELAAEFGIGVSDMIDEAVAMARELLRIAKVTE